MGMKKQPYDASWDRGNEAAWERKYQEWESRDWVAWLKAELKFPFRARRVEDLYLDMFAPEELHARNPFPVGCEVEVLGIADGDFDPGFDGVLVEVRGDERRGCRQKNGCLPLQDLEVRPKGDPNFWPVREFVVWYANR
jgi:hypothetical protein